MSYPNHWHDESFTMSLTSTICEREIDTIVTVFPPVLIGSDCCSLRKASGPPG